MSDDLIRLPPGVVIDAHRSGSIIWIDWICVPADQRGRGNGRAAYSEFEKHLPADVEQVRVMAADSGSGSSQGFWDALGFAFAFDGPGASGLPYESRQTMFKGVNGHPTPKPTWISDDQNEEGENAPPSPSVC